MATKSKENNGAKEKKFPVFTGKKKEYFDGLMKAREQIKNQIQFHTDEALNSNKDSAGDKVGMATHMADLGSDNSLHDMELKLLTDESDILEIIEESIHKLETDEYGLCEDCGHKISDERLKAKPYARFCVKCKSAREKNNDKVIG